MRFREPPNIVMCARAYILHRVTIIPPVLYILYRYTEKRACGRQLQQQQPVDEQNGGGDVGSHQTKFRSPANPADAEANRGPPGPHNTPPPSEHTLSVVSLRVHIRAHAIHN
uniref:Uncharacterized protein n=1 Tax=Schizaphis graminum TaxID=13262 RepID=A0A2S2PT77_SCHGA